MTRFRISIWLESVKSNAIKAMVKDKYIVNNKDMGMFEDNHLYLSKRRKIVSKRTES